MRPDGADEQVVADSAGRDLQTIPTIGRDAPTRRGGRSRSTPLPHRHHAVTLKTDGFDLEPTMAPFEPSQLLSGVRLERQDYELLWT